MSQCDPALLLRDIRDALDRFARCVAGMGRQQGPHRWGAKTLDAQIADGTAKVSGDAGVLKQLASTMVDFDPRFEITAVEAGT